MADLKQIVQQAMKRAMLEKNKLKLTTIRMLLAQIKQVEIDTKSSLDETAVLQIIQKMVKQRKDSITQFNNAKRTDLAEKEMQEIEYLNEFLPKQLSPEAVAQHVQEALKSVDANGMKDMGKVMAYLKPKLQGKVDMSEVSKLLKEKLTQ